MTQDRVAFEGMAEELGRSRSEIIRESVIVVLPVSFRIMPSIALDKN